MNPTQPFTDPQKELSLYAQGSYIKLYSFSVQKIENTSPGNGHKSYSSSPPEGKKNYKLTLGQGK